KSILFGKVLHTTKNGNEYCFIGVRDKRKGKETVLYTIPNNNNNLCPYIKGIHRDELDGMWQLLLKQGKITRADVKQYFPDLEKEGGCYWSVFYGFVNLLYPNQYIKERGKIVKNIKK